MLLSSEKFSRPFTAIAAMAKNRVIGNGNAIPWHIPEDFKFFKQTTMGGILLMGRKTYESIGRPLPGRVTVVLSRSGKLPAGTLPSENLFCIRELSELEAIAPERKIFVAGGAEIYRQLLPHCSEIFLTTIDAEPVGDAFFPPFEDDFDAGTELLRGENFVIRKFLRRDFSKNA
ncbi:MAG: dihydrofolate reductase [Opitutales bacterium]|nr:dihydrofolate reductase [Opitutales bacterium]